MKKGVILLGIFACLSATAQESRGVCGTTVADQLATQPRLIENLAAVDAGMVSDRDIKYVPVFFHLVADASGNGRVKEIKVLEQLCALNAAFWPVGIQFYLSPHPTFGLFDKTINNNGVYTTQSNTFLMNTKRHQNAINYFITDVADSGNTGPGEVLAYYTPFYDWIVSKRDRINGLYNNSTIPHETGHFFSLDHPFFGWEGTSGFGPGSTGWPVAPAVSPGGVATEKQNGSNCTTAADRICDTPPDYLFGFQQFGCGPYNGGAKDPMGVLVDPDEQNMMSYFEQCSEYHFSPLQMAAMLADLQSPSRNFLDNSFAPISDSVFSPLNLLISPANLSTVQGYNNVLLEWNAVQDATHYLIEIDQNGSYNTDSLRTYITTNTSLLIKDFGPSRTYYWRVKPFNYYATCAAPRARNFKTPATTVSTVEIEGLDAWQISPNPVTASDNAHITVSASAEFKANISIIDAAGKVIRQVTTQTFNEGSTVYDLPLEGLNHGFYFIQLDNGKARDIKKLTIF